MQSGLNQKTNEKIVISQSLTLRVQKMNESEQLIYLNGFICAHAGLLPDVASFEAMDKNVRKVYTNVREQVISKSGAIQILVEASTYIRSQKDKASRDKLLHQFEDIVESLTGQIMCDRKYLRMKWMKQHVQIQGEQNVLPKTSSLKLQDEDQSMKLIRQLQEQDEREIRQAKKRAEKESEKMVIQFLKDEEKKQDHRKKELKQKQNMKLVCDVCAEQISYTKLGTLDCGHVFHKECIKGYISAVLGQKKIDIPCPSACGALLSANDIDEYSDEEMRKKYLQYSLDVYVERNGKDTSWCPTAGCTAVFSFDEGLDNYRCPACCKHYCLSCQCDYHKGMNCKQYKISKSFGEDDKKFVDFVAGAKFKQCPNCKFWVERSAGCNAMKCRCGIQFCYDCGGIGCPHGSCKNKKAS